MNYSSKKSFEKSKYFSSKHSSYFDVYDQVLENYYGKNITFVEIGVLGGGSLFMWKDLFGPKARIIGIDKNPSAKFWETYGFEIFIGDQSSKEFWDDFKKTIGEIDILVDDGGHTYLQQIVTLESIKNNVKERGLIIFEDTHSSYLKNFGPSKYSFIKYTHRIIDKINLRNSYHRKSFNDFYSVEFFESIVVFRLSKKSEKKSEIVNNTGKKAYDLVDYRDHNINNNKNIIFKKLNNIYEKIKNFQKLNLIFKNAKRNLRQ